MFTAGIEPGVIQSGIDALPAGLPHSLGKAINMLNNYLGNRNPEHRHRIMDQPQIQNKSTKYGIFDDTIYTRVIVQVFPALFFVS